MHAAGAYRTGVAVASEVEAWARNNYDAWIAGGSHAGMTYMERYGEVRDDPRLLLEGAKSLVVGAFSYATSAVQPEGIPRFARYALGSDYHSVLRRRLEPVMRTIEQEWGARCRICIDTAPLRERYWAARAGVGFIGRNNQLIIPGAGSWFVLATIVTTLTLPPDLPVENACGECRLCVDACPGGALRADGRALDANRCLSYLTIEHRGELSDGLRLGNRVYGCDVCQLVCPHNRESVSPPALPEFEPRPALMRLTAGTIAAMTREEFSLMFRDSAVKRTKLDGLQRNLRHIE